MPSEKTELFDRLNQEFAFLQLVSRHVLRIKITNVVLLQQRQAACWF